MAALGLFWLTTLWLGAVSSASSAAVDEDFDITIRMPNATSQRKDDLVCHSYKLPEQESYISFHRSAVMAAMNEVRFIPHASMRVAHHMSVYGCKQPSSATKYWSCPLYEEMNIGVCGSGSRHIVFSWANDAPAKNLPEGVGLRVGGTTGIDYLVLQLHYKNPFGVEAADTSGVTLKMTHKRPLQQAGYYVVGNTVGSIPPQNPAFKMESACIMNLNYTIYPIGYRTHGHQIAVVSSGYRIRDGKWMELGRMSPQRPQTFYNVSTPDLDIRNGDVVASRCTFNSMSRNHTTVIGRKNADEMCKIFILYSTYEQKDLSAQFCFHSDTFRWQDYYNSTPPDASSLSGIPGADEIRHRFNMDPSGEN